MTANRGEEMKTNKLHYGENIEYVVKSLSVQKLLVLFRNSKSWSFMQSQWPVCQNWSTGDFSTLMHWNYVCKNHLKRGQTVFFHKKVPPHLFPIVQLLNCVNKTLMETDLVWNGSLIMTKARRNNQLNLCSYLSRLSLFTWWCSCFVSKKVLKKIH